jgi:hypothetical protein
MGKRALRSRNETLDDNDKEVSPEGRLRDIESLFDALSIQKLRAVRVLAGKKQKEKLAEAKEAVLAEVEEKVKALGLRLKDVFPSHTANKPTLPPKYRSPTGDTWS